MTERVVAIVGTATTSRLEVNKEPPEVERWGQSGAWRFMEKVDRWFEMHNRAWLLRRAGKNFFPYQNFMQTFKGPVYTKDVSPTIPTSVAYPLDEIAKHFFGEEPPYFTSSIAYMTALAIYEGVNTIKYFGVDMASKMEYMHQRMGCEYFIGWARSNGIDVIIPKSSPILKSPLYGFRRETKVIQESLMERMAKLRGEEKIIEESLLAKRGQIKEAEYWLNDEKGLELTETIPDGAAVVVHGQKNEKPKEAVKT